ncbi:MAG: hypothetical protein IPO27_07080 [Bacteroidetes bacterium]|nr:hypothetical protein [Bacteroidota bacterium]
MLRTAALGLLDLSKNTQFKTIVNKEVSKQFDGDDNALLKTINLDVQNALPQSFYATILKYASTLNLDVYTTLTEITESINGFTYFNDSAYIQIYIPNYPNTNLNNDPIICYNLNDDSILPGFYIDNNGIVQPIEVDEQMAINSNVWVISVSETQGIKSTAYGTNVAGVPATGEDLIVSLDSAVYYDKKEGWGNGRADIAYITFKYRYCGEPTVSSVNETKKAKFGDDIFDRISDAKLSQNMVYFPNFLIANEAAENDIFRPDETLCILFYEKDRRRKFEQQILWASCFPFYFTYCSKQNPYLTSQTGRNQYGLFSTWYPLILTDSPAGPSYISGSGADFYISLKSWPL